ncbi:hypothetical protein [Streptomyces sp. NPDC052535]|uniref:hypothetical protein n=1 Tax=unclassified Streptomyces TaxID=2593676 RepID=UPI00343B9857
MATAMLSPNVARDEISLGDASVLFAETGHPASVSTLRRWCKKHRVPLARYGRSDHASWTRLLLIHSIEVDARDGL